ncbi:hypothetical protein [Candidatus Enterococcus mansonii]|uniref:Uncharacterized protein n=1 Tax=Candidatus Enterococcus mansonii TaxID=1834181 RepID=A0A242CE52_9ENTE|nr:hypothetical protein [Enterococcus sp. 4G2_DIV0659]OTO08439.1 hypothetical protein A5880_001439 [Enterococcus sp. 4G2_DIV0659]
MNEEKEAIATEEQTNATAAERGTDYSNSKKVLVFQLCLGVIILSLLLSLALLSYRLVPNNHKLSGDWQTVDQVYQLKITGDEATLLVEELNGMTGVQMEIKTTVHPTDSTYYQGKGTSVSLMITKDKQDQQTLEAIKQQNNYYKVISETAKKLIVAYTPEATIAAFNVESLDASFRFNIKKWQYGVIPKEIHFQNDTFAANGLRLIKK